MKNPEEDQINVGEIFYIIRKRKWFIIIPTIIITAIAYAGTFFLTPLFRSQTVISIDRPSNVSRELSNLIGERNQSREERYNKQVALETELTSVNYLTELINDMKLDDDEEIIREATKRKESIPGYTLDQIKEILLIEKLKNQISVDFQGSDQFIISVQSTEPHLARDMANNLASIIEREKAKYELEKILDNQDFTDIQLEKATYDYQEAVDSLNSARARLSTLQLPENITSESNRLEIFSTVDKTDLDITDLEREQTDLKSQLRSFNLENERMKYSSEIVDIKSNINVLISSYARNLKKYSWDDQNVINVNVRFNDNLTMLEERMTVEIDRKYSSLPEGEKSILKRYYVVKENIGILQSKKKKFEETLTDIDEIIRLKPQIESEILDLTNRAENLRKYRDAFQSEETTVGILSERVKERTKYIVIEAAQLPLAPFWPKKQKLVMIGLILGLVFGGAIVILIEIMDDSIKSIEVIESEFELPVLAAIPRIENLKVGK